MYVSLEEPGKPQKKSCLILAGSFASVHVFMGVIYGIFWAQLSLIDSIYFTMSTVLLIGYGDKHFLHDRFSLIFGTVYILLGIFVMSFLTGAVLRESVEHWNAETQKEIARQIMTSSKTQKSPLQIAINSLTRRFVYIMLFFAGLMVACSMLFAVVEGWSVLEATYFLAVSWSSLGTGDYVTNTRNGKVLAAVVLPLGVFTTAAVFSTLASLPFYVEKAEEEHSLVEEYGTALTVSSVDVIAKTKELQIMGLQANRDFITRNEFIIWLLAKLGKIDTHDIKQLGKAFDLIDFNGDGRLDLGNIEGIKRAAMDSDDHRRIRRLQSTMEFSSAERARRATLRSGTQEITS